MVSVLQPDVQIGLEFHIRIACNKHSPVTCPKPAFLHRGNKATLACHASLRLGAGGFCQLPVPVKPFRTNDDVFALLPDILCAYWNPAARSAESSWSIAERRAVSSFQAVNASIYAILQQYEQLTGNALIMDSNLAANALPISILCRNRCREASLCG